MFRCKFKGIIEPNADIILDELRASRGFKADRQFASRRYQDRFKMSKKTFKKAIGALYREKLIEIKEMEFT
jgi:predicted RNA-binding protein (virulence factor B family)